MGPFGDGFTETLATLDFTGFAGGFWDSENNGDHFGAREYQKTHGSWLSPDPAGMVAVNPWNPQTWNRYAYVGNNPTTYNDPSGLQKPLCGFWGNLHCNSGDPSQPYGDWFGLGWNPVNTWIRYMWAGGAEGWGRYSIYGTDFFTAWNWDGGAAAGGGNSCAVIGAGVNDNPGNPDFAQAANQYGAITAFPYGGESGPAGIASVAFQSAGFANSSTAVLANAINSAAASNDSLTLYLYSGSAQAFTTAVENGMISPTAVDAIQQIVFLSPGTGDVAPTTMGLPDSAVQTFWGNQGIQDNLVWMLNGSSMSAPSTLLPCGHSFACEFNSPQVPKPRGRCAGH
jgi:RHS repeat-associated protein